MRPERTWTGCWWGALCLTLQPAWAQTANTVITPSLMVQVQSTSNALVSYGQQGKKDLVTTVQPGIAFRVHEGALDANGQWQLTGVHYTRNSQPDRALPSGQSTFRLTAPQTQSGVEANVSAAQVRSTILARNSSTPTTGDTYTNVSLGVSPFFSQPLSSTMRVSGRLSRTQTASIGEGEGMATRSKGLVTDDRISLEQAPRPFGWGLTLTHTATDTQQLQSTSLDERSVRLRTDHTLWSELTWGLNLGRAHNQIGTLTTDDTPRGVHVRWTPLERSDLQAELERRYFGNAWKLQASHRLPWLAFNLFADRAPVTYAATLGTIQPGSSLRDLYAAMLTTRVPDAAERAQLVDDLVARRQLSTTGGSTGTVYDLQARLQQRTTATMSFMGRRDIVTFAGGLTRTKPLTWDQESELLSNGQRTREYYVDAQLNHLLTSTQTLSGGLRWTRATVFNLYPSSVNVARDFSWRLSYITNLSPRTTTTVGLRRQITHTPPSSTGSGDSNETTVGLSLLHRF